jgi:hypothetical protein
MHGVVIDAFVVLEFFCGFCGIGIASLIPWYNRNIWDGKAWHLKLQLIQGKPRISRWP